jgi:MFS family permease
LVASLLSAVCYAVGRGYWWLVAGAVLEGLWLALFSGNNEALLYESAKQSGRQAEFHRYLGQLNVAMEVAGFVATAAGGVLAAWSFGWALWLTAAAQVPALVASFWLVEPARHEVQAPSAWGHFREAFGYMRRNATLRRLSLARLLGDGFQTFSLWPVFYSQLMPAWAVGLAVSANYLESAVGFQVSGWFLRRVAAIKIILGSRVYAGALMIPAVLFPSPLSPVLMALGGASYGPEAVALGTLLHKEFTDHQRATMASIIAVLANGLFAGFGLVIGWVADHWGVGRAILVGQLCLLPMIGLYWRVWRSK